MSDPATKVQMIDAAVDVASFGKFINDLETQPNGVEPAGTFTDRNGRVRENLDKLIAGWNAQAAEADGIDLENLTPDEIIALSQAIDFNQLTQAQRDTDVLSGTKRAELTPNGKFRYWYNRPTSEEYTTPGAGAGSVASAIPDGWYAGPGTGSAMKISNPHDDEDLGTADRMLVLQWLVGVSSGGDIHAENMTLPSFRGTFLEWNGRISPEFVVGKTVKCTFRAKASGSASIIPIVYTSTGTAAHSNSKNYYVGNYVTSDSAGGEMGLARVYECTADGVSHASTNPTGTGTSITDGTCTWRYVGEGMGRIHQIYEAGASATVAQVGWGSPVASAVASLTTSYQDFEFDIFLPLLSTPDTSTYTGQPTDNVSRVHAPFTDNGFIGVGFDHTANGAYGPTYTIKDVSFSVEADDGLERVSKDLSLLASNGFTQTLKEQFSHLVPTSAQVIAGTSKSLAITPGNLADIPALPKAGGTVSIASGVPTLDWSYGVASVVRSAAGKYYIAFTTPFSSANYTISANAQTTNGGAASGAVLVTHTTRSTTGVTLQLCNNTGTPGFVDPVSFHFSMSGDQ